MNKVLLICREMTIVHAPCLVQGITGEKVGVSKFSPKHSCHILELTPEAYEKNAKALMQACHIALRRWEPHFVFEEVPEKVREFWDGYNAGMDGEDSKEEASFEWSLGRSAAIEKELTSLLESDQENVPAPTGRMQTMDTIASPEITAETMKAADEYAATLTRPYGEQAMEALASAPMRGDLMGAPDTVPTATIVECGHRLKEMAGLDGIHLPPVTPETKYWSLMKIAKMEGADLSKCKTNAERARAINEKRCQPR